MHTCCGRRKLPSTGHNEAKTGSLFLVAGQRVEMNQRTGSHSSTVRSPEISDVSLLREALVQ